MRVGSYPTPPKSIDLEGLDFNDLAITFELHKVGVLNIHDTKDALHWNSLVSTSCA